MIIYKITNLIDGKIYIGKTTKRLEERDNTYLMQKTLVNIIFIEL